MDPDSWLSLAPTLVALAAIAASVLTTRWSLRYQAKLTYDTILGQKRIELAVDMIAWLQSLPEDFAGATTEASTIAVSVPRGLAARAAALDSEGLGLLLEVESRAMAVIKGSTDDRGWRATPERYHDGVEMAMELMLSHLHESQANTVEAVEHLKRIRARTRASEEGCSSGDSGTKPHFED